MGSAAVLLFVYGTLKTSQRNHRLLADQRYVGPAATEPCYRLIDMGPYPGLIHDDAHGLAVRGELWAVSRCCLVELDDFEGDEYARGPVTVAGIDGTVEAYFWVAAVPERVRSSGEWPPLVV